jgi:hypothetical protein
MASSREAGKLEGLIVGGGLWQNLPRNRSEATMNDAGTLPRHVLEIRELTAEAGSCIRSPSILQTLAISGDQPYINVLEEC